MLRVGVTFEVKTMFRDSVIMVAELKMGLRLSVLRLCF